ncbi:MAG: carbamate kinase [Actinobacteria bacterium]|nr:MAG: carbamate kinase [Actinomycetota bacterium]TML81869.1 MAG: carbamate kinase [Actinomycetota bacterium]
MRPGERGTAAEQLANLRRTVVSLRPLLAEAELVITHGNGPQVGNELLRQERAADEAPPLPLWLAVAQTQAEIGALIASELRPALAERETACVLTHVRVAADDLAFDRPTKPIGPFYSAEQAVQLERERGWDLVSDANRGHRRVVPSPSPLEIVELDAIRRLAGAGTVTVACGGGGIPVVRREGRLSGVDAVIDKDRASALLARELEAMRLIILTEVPAVYRNFGAQEQEEIRELSREDVEALLPQLSEGSMRPKVESALAFAGETLITNIDVLEDALAGHAGTWVRP